MSTLQLLGLLGPLVLALVVPPALIVPQMLLMVGIVGLNRLALALLGLHSLAEILLELEVVVVVAQAVPVMQEALVEVVVLAAHLFNILGLLWV
jgi:hypothetical protein